ncbi:hypothetical protein [Mycolicibacterium sp.]|uniref:hypothetical protein n=1 Tax=Mycolicibacterium sp. TaxID=2320850 RepID=UPI0037C98879
MVRRTSAICTGLAAFGLMLGAPAAAAETIDSLLASHPEASERPIVSGLRDQGYGYLDYGVVNLAWNQTCDLFGGAHGASDIAVNDAKSELLGMRFTPQEADAIIGIALKVHGRPGIESCP